MSPLTYTKTGSNSEHVSEAQSQHQFNQDRHGEIPEFSVNVNVHESCVFCHIVVVHNSVLLHLLLSYNSRIKHIHN